MDPLLLTTALSALLPAAVDGIKSFIGSKTGNKPAVLTAEDYSKVVDADIRKLEVLSKLDSPGGETSKWANNLRSVQRPAVVMLVLLAWLYGAVFGLPGDVFQTVSQLASTVFFYLFGDRTNLYLKK